MIVPEVTDKTIVDNTQKNDYLIQFNSPLSIEFSAFKFEEDLDNIEVAATYTNNGIVAMGEVKTETVNSMLGKITVNFNSLETEGITEVALTITSGDYVYTKTFTVEVVEQLPASWTVEAVDGAQYGFELNDNGYYESKNKGASNSYAICKVNIVNPTGLNVYFDCINYAESNYDYGLLSKVDTPLDLTYGDDSSDKLQKNFKGNQSASIQTVEYGPVEGTIYVKFKKDSGQDSNNDSLQFKVRIEE
jgi:hypothetical protein